MIWRALAALGLTAVLVTPAAAFERMQRNSCIRAIAAVHEMLPDGSDARHFRRLGDGQVVTGDGWCRIRGTGEDEFTTLDWRAEGIGDWINGQVPPRALEVRVDGLNAGAGKPPLSFEATLRQIPDAGMLMVERAELSNSRGDVLAGSLVLERVYLTSLAMMQVSFGSVTFKAGLMQMDLTGEVENPFGFALEAELHGTPTAQRDAMFDLLSRVPAGVISDASRAELTAFAGDLPKPEGSLELAVNSARGLGLAQAGMAMYRFAENAIDGSGSGGDGDALFFDGLTIDADWTPRDGQTD